MTVNLQKIYSGKVRDLYAIDQTRMLMVASDRLSAFDVILPQPVPDKGKILTALSAFWFAKLADLVPNHLTGERVEDLLPPEQCAAFIGRSLIVKRLKPLPIEAIVRGYIAGSGWKDYQKTQSICGIALPPGLKHAAKLPAPIFTPSTKACALEHDENIGFAECETLIGKELAAKLRDTAINLYQTAARYAEGRGIIIADTKFEFGLDENGTLTLMDEVLTPDSSRFWPAESWQEGSNPPSFDKQFVRDWLEQSAWNKTPPAPDLPKEILEKTAAKYQQALRLLTA
ncbi:phosphoribosylaminoimidazolesuccinocarboxamide synthase [Ventosimonas gracilis]|uniref:Phosphoribosylaminoimidazole-succinocarboxamide synthase n=1 Tax=Ventosimonas gracilis TaxID=1680762 RepID=A0A139SP91_9GAMM|nr:phosphoribosylaminoimidazolesuccinocarboxamide synthase [Ventosimonas gracilis]KXU36409.1 phosphoribosylaminoimidazolesuccinocarboxamide synthase [Ventosimonas gracilis]